MKSTYRIASKEISLTCWGLSLLLSACAFANPSIAPPSDTPAPTQSPVPPTPQNSSPSLPLETLRNIDYHSVRLHPFPYEFTLTDGIYYAPDGPYANEAHMKLMEPIAYGDLNQDGTDDAAVILEGWFGGTGQFIFLAAVVDENDKPVNTATTLLGDRVVVNASRIQKGKIVLDILTHAPADPLCCPSLTTAAIYQLAENELVETPNP